MNDSHEEITAIEGKHDVFDRFLGGYDARLDETYRQALERTHEEIAPKFGPDDIPPVVREERVKQLKAKLAEYTERIISGWQERPYVPPEAIGGIGGNKYKRDLLRLALRPGG